ncbi:MAG: hypothetical protein JW910_14445 [Anaerolineae bacterium]|nr:hypothetical protein [Anaerolineae bacterium]
MSIVSFGELLIDFVALETGVSVGEASGFEKKPGGAPANVAVAVARLGVPSAFLGQVGDDPFGHYLAGVLRTEGVNVDGLRFSDEARTMLAFVSLRGDGERSFSFYRHPSADVLMKPEDLALDVIDAAKVFHFGSVSMIGEPSGTTTLTAARYAKEHGLLVSYDPNLRLSLWPSEEAAREGMLRGLDYAQVVKVSAEELDFLTGGAGIDPLWRDGMQLIVVTQGAEGATAHTRAGSVYVPGFSVGAVDTTGAGDGFVAGMLIQLYEAGGLPEDLAGALRFANAVGALTTTQRGAIPAMPDRETVLNFLADMG